MNDPATLRTVHFISTLRASMLVNGAALGNTHIESWVDTRNPGDFSRAVLIVECDDEWDEDGDEGRGRHIHHNSKRYTEF